MRLSFRIAVALVAFSLAPSNGAEPVPSVAEQLRTVTVLDLSTAQRLAVAGNPQLESVQARIDQAWATLRQSRAPFLPTVTASASAFHNEVADGLGTFGIQNPEQYYGVGIDAAWLIYDGLGRRYRAATTTLAWKQALVQQDEVVRSLLGAVASTYYAAQLAREERVIAEADRAYNRRLLNDAQTRFRAGAGALSDVLGFEIRANAAEASMITAAENYDTIMTSLGALLGLGDAAMPPDLSLAPLGAAAPEELAETVPEPHLDYARDHRPLLQSARIGTALAAASTAAARSQFHPTVTLLASADASRGNDVGFRDEDTATAVGIALEYTLFDGGLRRAEVVEAEAAEDEAAASLRDSSVAVAAEVRQAVIAINAARRQLELQRRTVELVARNRDLVEKEYSAGQTSLVRLNEAQRDLVTARARLALALVSLRTAWSDLHTATGRILEHGEASK